MMVIILKEKDTRRELRLEVPNLSKDILDTTFEKGDAKLIKKFLDLKNEETFNANTDVLKWYQSLPKHLQNGAKLVYIDTLEAKIDVITAFQGDNFQPRLPENHSVNGRHYGVYF